MNKVVGIGAGGHAKVVLDILRLMGIYQIIGLLDPKCIGSKVSNVPVLGGDELLPYLREDGVEFAFIGVGAVGNNMQRIRLFEKVQAAGFAFVNAIHPASVLASDIQLGQGIAIMAGSIINSDTQIGDNVIINTSAIVEHDCKIAAHAHISPGAVLCGGVRVGVGAHVGAGATVRQGITIGDNALVGAGAVVVQNVPSQTIVVGVPARPIRGINE
ncbi:MAG: acetyltransferase [Chloroflexi bacterium]|nr:acetyltransferase [Chloroflexota bacterium]